MGVTEGEFSLWVVTVLPKPGTSASFNEVVPNGWVSSTRRRRTGRTGCRSRRADDRPCTLNWFIGLT